MDLRKLAGNLRFLAFQVLDSRAQGRRIDPRLHDGVYGALQFALDLAGASLQPRTVARDRFAQAITFLVIDPHEAIKRGAVREQIAQAVDDDALDIAAIDHAAVLARAALAIGRALQFHADLVTGDGRHAAAARAAFDQAGQEPGRLAVVFRVLRMLGCLDRARALPQVIVDDAQVRRLGHDHGAGVVRPRDAVAGRRVLAHALPVPDDAADIEFVEQHAALALEIAVDRRRVPCRRPRRPDGARIEIGGDLAWRLALGVAGENLAHDVGLGVDDLKRAGLALDRAIAVCLAAGMAAVAQHAEQPAPRVRRQVLDVKFTHERAQRTVDAADNAARGDDLDVGELENFPQLVIVGLVAGEPVDILDHQHVERLRFGGGDKRGNARPVCDRGARNAAILEGQHQPCADPRARLAVQGVLILDRAILLAVA